MAAPIRVIVVDDHPIVRDGLVAVIKVDPRINVIASYSRGADLLEHLERERPDLVLLDVRLPEMDGLEALTRLRARWPEQRVLMVSSQETDQAVQRAIKAGAVGYVLKKQPSGELIEAIVQGAGGKAALGAAVSSLLTQKMDAPEVSPREIEILKAIANGRSNQEIANMLGLSHHTVRNHIVSIMDKLTATDRTQAVIIAIQRGIIDVD